MFIPRDPPPVDEWEYFKFSHHITFKLEPQEGLNGIVEPIMIVRRSSFAFKRVKRKLTRRVWDSRRTCASRR